MNRIIIKIYKLKLSYSILLLFLTTFIPGTILMLVSSVVDIGTPTRTGQEDGGFLYLLITAVLFAPLYETFVLQYLPCIVTGRWYKKKAVLLSIISGSIFGILHWGNLLTFIITGGIGFFLQLWFILLFRRYNTYIAFFSVAGVHLVRNLLSVIAISLMK